MDDYWKIKRNFKEKEDFSLVNWIKKHWESIILSIIVWGLLIVVICQIIQLIITLKKL